MNKVVEKVERLIEGSRLYIIDQEYQSAIDNMEQVLGIIKEYSFLQRSYLDEVLFKLDNLYGITKQYERAVELEEIQISNMLNDHGITSLNDATLPEEDASKLISLYLCSGTAYMNLKQYEKAGNQYTMGYVVAYVHFGEYDVRTLKQRYNIACAELISEDAEEGVRQLKYCYYDMREHLGEENEYTQKAKNTLLQMKEEPDSLYELHLQMRKIIKEEISKMWK